MEWIEANRSAVGWVLLWAWIALTVFIVSYGRVKSTKIYVINILLLIGWIYMFFGEYAK